MEIIKIVRHRLEGIRALESRSLSYLVSQLNTVIFNPCFATDISQRWATTLEISAVFQIRTRVQIFWHYYNPLSKLDS
jgi:hypothetical protein